MKERPNMLKTRKRRADERHLGYSYEGDNWMMMAKRKDERRENRVPTNSQLAKSAACIGPVRVKKYLARSTSNRYRLKNLPRLQRSSGHSTRNALLVIWLMTIMSQTTIPSSGVTTRQFWMVAMADASSSSASAATGSRSSRVAPPKKESDESVLQIAETEIWDGQTWKADPVTRWTDPNTGKVVSGPNEIQKNYEWTSNWKIVTGGLDRDEHGWEYQTSSPAAMIRQRLWFRTYQVDTTADTSDDDEEAGKGVTVKRGKRKKASSTKQKQRHSLVRAVKDDFTFKGFGIGFYKSLVFPQSGGIAFRLPITYNFDTFERNPGFPACSTSIAFFYPWTVVTFVSVSARLEFLQWICWRLWQRSCAVPAFVLWFFVRSLWIILAALVYPLTRQWLVPELPIWINDLWTGGSSSGGLPSRPEYKRTVEERLGYSVSWRFSLRDGYQWRWSVWHFWAPTLTSLWEDTWLGRNLLPDAPDWFRRRSAALGLSTTAPIQDAPYVGSSVLLSLSGYYIRRRFGRLLMWKNRRKRGDEMSLQTKEKENHVENELAQQNDTESSESEEEKSKRLASRKLAAVKES